MPATPAFQEGPLATPLVLDSTRGRSSTRASVASSSASLPRAGQAANQRRRSIPCLSPTPGSPTKSVTVRWSLEMRAALMRLARVAKGRRLLRPNKQGNQCFAYPETLEEWTAKLRRVPGGECLTWPKVRERFRAEKKWWGTVKWLLDRSGPELSKESGRINASDAHWEAYYREFPYMPSTIRTKAYCLPNSDTFDNYSAVFSDERATGLQAKEASELPRSSQMNRAEILYPNASDSFRRRWCGSDVERIIRKRDRWEAGWSTPDPDTYSGTSDSEVEEFLLPLKRARTQTMESPAAILGSHLMTAVIILTELPGARDIEAAVVDFQTRFRSKVEDKKGYIKALMTLRDHATSVVYLHLGDEEKELFLMYSST